LCGQTLPAEARPVAFLRKRPQNVRKTALFLLSKLGEGEEDLSLLLDRCLQKNGFAPKDKALLTELVYGVLRQKGYIDWLIDRFSKVKAIQRPIRQILRIALYQLLFLDRVPFYALVNTAVELSKEAGGAGAGRFVNGLLRNLIRQKEALPRPDPASSAAFISVMESHPQWMVERWLARWGEEKTLALCRANNEPPPMTLRVNRLKTTRARLLAELEALGACVRPCTLSPDGLVLKGLSIRSLPAFDQGEFYVQDEGAQLISCLLAPRPGEAILDLCAAPGGKTSHLAELSGGKAEIIATDIRPERLALLRENIQRLGTPGVRVEAMSEALSARRQYDRILIDAPCSALGVLRRIPEGKWHKPPSIVSSMARTQLELLEKAWPLLKTGGRLLYATCSTEEEENEALSAVFMRRHPEMVLEDPSESLPRAARRYVSRAGYFSSLPNSECMDHFFALRWLKP